MPRFNGELDGHPAGEWYDSRKSLTASGIHRSLQAGICGSPDEVLSRSFSPVVMMI